MLSSLFATPFNSFAEYGASGRSGRICRNERLSIACCSSGLTSPRFSSRKCVSANNSSGSSVSPSMPRSSTPVRASASCAMRCSAIAHPLGLLDIGASPARE